MLQATHSDMHTDIEILTASTFHYNKATSEPTHEEKKKEKRKLFNFNRKEITPTSIPPLDV